MLPYFGWSAWSFGPITIQAWGLFVALGVASTLGYLKWVAKEHRLAFAPFVDLTFWVLLAGVIGARAIHILFYNPEFYRAFPAEIIMIQHGGLSSTGGMLGGIVAALVYLRQKKLSWWTYGDALVRALPLGFFFGRLGCFFTHLHLGKLSAQWWAINVPGGARLELSVLEAVWWLLLGLFFWRAPRFKTAGSYLVAIIFLYAPLRFFLDFLRATDLPQTDARYLGLTPAQYIMLGLLVLGAVLWYIQRHVRERRGVN